MKPTREELKEQYHVMPGRGSFEEEAVDLAIWAMEQVEKPEHKAIGFDEWKKKNQDYSWREGDGSFACRVWNAAQSALIVSGQYIRVPTVEEWPEWATCIVGTYLHKGEAVTGTFALINRPTPAWRPKEGDKVWQVLAEGAEPVLTVYDGHDHGGFCAAAESLDEITWTRDQFRQRGRFWESGK